jgi:integrase/recombinase XerD
MSALLERSADYLSLRRALGYKLAGHDAALSQFIAWLDEAGASVITADLALAWAQSTSTFSPVRERQRLGIARGFAEYMHAIDSRTEVPARDLLPARQHRTAPYIYAPGEISMLMAATASLKPPLKAATYETFIGLLACTGLRVGEATGLDRSDVDLEAGALLVRFGKNGRSRLVPVHPSTVTALSRYSGLRDALCPQPTSPSFFVTVRGARLADSSFGGVFVRLRHQTGLDARGHGRMPRLHDIRHTFVVRTMLNWYGDGLDVQARLPVLSTYLGHVNPKTTYWYQEAVPDLLAIAAERLEPSES